MNAAKPSVIFLKKTCNLITLDPARYYSLAKNTQQLWVTSESQPRPSAVHYTASSHTFSFANRRLMRSLFVIQSIQPSASGPRHLSSALWYRGADCFGGQLPGSSRGPWPGGHCHWLLPWLTEPLPAALVFPLCCSESSSSPDGTFRCHRQDPHWQSEMSSWGASGSCWSLLAPRVDGDGSDTQASPLLRGSPSDMISQLARSFPSQLWSKKSC